MNAQILLGTYYVAEESYFRKNPRRDAAGDYGDPDREVRIAAMRAVKEAVEALCDPTTSWFTRWRKVRAAKKSLRLLLRTR